MVEMWKSGDVTLYLGDCLEVLPTLPAGSVDAAVTDPPFNVGKDFENDALSVLDFQAFCNRWALELYRLRLEIGRAHV